MFQTTAYYSVQTRTVGTKDYEEVHCATGPKEARDEAAFLRGPGLYVRVVKMYQHYTDGKLTMTQGEVCK